MIEFANGLENALALKGISRRDFLKFCSAMAAALALPPRYVPRIEAALATAPRPPVVWLEFQDCCGDSESFLRASRPSVADIVLDTLSVNYHETIMAPAGKAAEKSLYDTVEQSKGKYLVVIEGSIPTKDGGVYCTIGGKTALDIAQRVCKNAAATITVGACAFFGGWPSASPNPTGAMGVGEAVPGLTLINLPGCPHNVVNLTATVVHFLTFGALPRPTNLDDRCSRTANASTTIANAARITTPVNSSKTGAMPAIAMGGASTKWDAKVPRHFTIVRPCAGTMARRGPLARDTVASVVRNRISGTRCRPSTGVCRTSQVLASK